MYLDIAGIRPLDSLTTDEYAALYGAEALSIVPTNRWIEWGGVDYITEGESE